MRLREQTHAQQQFKAKVIVCEHANFEKFLVPFCQPNACKTAACTLRNYMQGCARAGRAGRTGRASKLKAQGRPGKPGFKGIGDYE